MAITELVGNWYSPGTKAFVVVDAAIAGPVTIEGARKVAGCSYSHAARALDAAWWRGFLRRARRGRLLVYQGPA